MDAAKSAIHKFTSNKGHRTHVEESVNPAITRETVKPTRHEQSTEAIDREVHQHHYHTTVQPITHQEVLPEKHTHNMLAIEKKEFHHGDHEAVKEKVAAEIAQFKNHSITHETHHTRSVAPSVVGEHVHHHVHETVQPVIHKETIQPEVVHTTVPIHEVHHAEAQHHGISALPMKTLEEFTKIGGLLGGSRTSTHEEYDGSPRPYNKDLNTTVDKALAHLHLGGSGHHHRQHDGAHHAAAGSAPATNEVENASSRVDRTNNTKTTTTTNTTTSTSGPVKVHVKRDSAIGGVNDTRTSQDSAYAEGNTNGNSNKKGSASLMDKLNPRIDADGDGKAGFMS